MHALSAPELLRVWERAEDRHPIDRGLALLQATCPGWDRQQLASLPIGRRDAMLLDLRERTFGQQLRGVGRCPHCAAQVEFSVKVSDLLGPAAGDVDDEGGLAPAEEFTFAADGCRLRCRLPNSFDLAEIVDCPDEAQARHRLLRRCVIEVVCDEARVPLSDLPETAIKALGAEMAQRDPIAELRLDLDCPDCRGRWLLALDILSFFWSEIAAQAKQLLEEVHVLARAYAWPEADILAMSSRRRRYYLKMVT